MYSIKEEADGLTGALAVITLILALIVNFALELGGNVFDVGLAWFGLGTTTAWLALIAGRFFTCSRLAVIEDVGRKQMEDLDG